MNRNFTRIAIVNRGEAAMRLIHAVREFNRENELELRTIALYTDPERRAMFVREADEAVCLGPPTFVDERDGSRKNAYLNYARLEEALLETRAEAVWVGWGFVAEHPEFADLCERLGIVFIGPSGNCMRLLGDKITSKQIAEKAGVPVAPWSRGPVASLEAARAQAEQIGYPLMIKATAGGGGRGIRAVREPGGLDEAFQRASSEALKGFGNATVFMERLVEGARHIEVQVIADLHGNVWSVGVRDCSVQRFNQKLIEESSSPVLTEAQEADIKAAAARLCKEADYHGAGTVEFLYQPADKSFAFMEVNARLQVEHPVTEVTTDLDLVKLQLHIARGGTLEGEPPPIRGRAVEIRLNAEDPDKDFAPAPGRVELLRMPTGAGVRVDTGIEQDDSIPSHFDSMIAKIIAHGRDRHEALSRLRRALSEMVVVVRGGTTNRAFLLDLLGRSEVVDGTADVGWLDRVPPSGWKHERPHAELALVMAAIESYEEEFEVERQVFLASAARGRPKLPAEVGRKVELRYGDRTTELEVFRYGDRNYRVEVDGQTLAINAEPLSPFQRRLICNHFVHRTVSVHDGVDYLVEVDGIPHRVSRDTGGVVRSPAPAVVVSVNVEPGQQIERGDTLAILEAMKLEMRVTAPFSGEVQRIEVTSNEQVSAGTVLVRLKPTGEEAVTERLHDLSFDCLCGESDEPSERSCRELFQELHYLVLGFDVDPATSGRLLDAIETACRHLPPDDAGLLENETLLLQRFADLCALAERAPEHDADFPLLLRPSPQESLFSYLRAIYARGEGLSTTFLENLKRALAHYKITSLDPSPELEEVLLWIHKSHSRVAHQLPAITKVLQRWLAQVDELAPQADDSVHALLDRLVGVSEGRFPAIADLAREVRYQYFDQPMFDQARQRAYAEAEAHLAQLAEHDGTEERVQHMAALVGCPQPLMNLLSDRFPTATRSMQGLILECLTRRYYRIRDLENLHIVDDDHQPMATGEYSYEDKRIRVITTHADLHELSRAGERMVSLVESFPQEHDVVIDFYVRSNGEAQSEEESLQRVQQALHAIPFPRAIRRIAVALRIPGGGLGVGGQRYFTFRPDGDGYREDQVYRGLHPMMAKRLHLWRLGNFDLERLPSVQDVYLMHAVARENPKDERLFAVAEVRDLTPVRDEDGRLVALPHLEQMLQEALAGIRVFQSARPRRKRLHWNRVLLYVWPPMRLHMDEIERIIQKLEPASRGLGLEKIVLRAQMPLAGDGELHDAVLHISNPAGHGVVIDVADPADDPIRPMTPYRQTVVKMRQRGLHYPYEIAQLLTPALESARSPFPAGKFTEYEFDDEHRFGPVHRSFGQNRANVVVGTISNFTSKYPEGMTRVFIAGDPSRGMGALAEPECSRIIAALDLAEQMRVPVEWFAVSAGARIAMDSGTENLDWTARVLRRLVEFTQAGGEVNVIVHGINVGAQSYWNAEATMLMHTRGILIMTAQGAMVLTGKQALDYSGSVSAEDNSGIGGYDRIMGPNGQAQYWAGDLEEACRILLCYYDHSYVMPGERFPRRAPTEDPIDRDIGDTSYGTALAGGFATVGEIFADETNPGRKKPFDIRQVMRAAADQDHEPLERWSGMRDAEIGVVWDAHLGGHPVCLVGLESRPLPRAGFVPADGPEQWTAGTLFPQSSRKVAWAINSASGNRPLVVLANLSGFDGSPEAMRQWQLEYGAEIGRAVVNFDGPLVFCVISRYHGGAFVVFSRALNENLEVAALEGAYASVIGGAPAAAVVFAREVKTQARSDAGVQELEQALANAEGSDRAGLRAKLDDRFKAVLAEKRGQLAEQFDRIHSVQRALEVGSVHSIVPPARLRPYLVEAVERGLARHDLHKSEESRDGDGESRPRRSHPDDEQSLLPPAARQGDGASGEPLADES